MNTTIASNVTAILSFTFGMLLLRVAMETSGLVERFVLRPSALTDPYSTWIALGLGAALLLISVLALNSTRPR